MLLFGSPLCMDGLGGMSGLGYFIYSVLSSGYSFSSFLGIFSYNFP